MVNCKFLMIIFVTYIQSIQTLRSNNLRCLPYRFSKCLRSGVKDDTFAKSPPNEGGRKSAAVVQGEKVHQSTVLSTTFSTAPPKGTRDFFPEDNRLKDWLFAKWRNVSYKFGFEEYDAPVLESEELYIRKAGEEVSQQLFNFEDKGGRRVSLRPEMTPSLARMVLSRKSGLPLPLKWFSIPQCWRYERMTRGRRREHYQWNMDIWGVKEVTAEVELISAIITSMQSMGLTSADVGIKINNRKLLNELMKYVGIANDKWLATCILIDKLDKVPLETISDDLDAIGVSKESVKMLLDLIQLNDLQKYSEYLGESSEGVREIRKLFELCTAYGIQDWVLLDSSVVRGLAYYTGTVFEGFDRTGELRAICGGGRYDKLLESLSGGKDSLPAVGFGFGDAVIVELLKNKNLLPNTQTPTHIDVVMYAMDGRLFDKALNLSQELRANNVNVDMVLEMDRKPKWVFQRGDRVGSKYVVMLAGDEDKEDCCNVKNLKDGTQNKIPYSQLVQTIKALINQNSI